MSRLEDKLSASIKPAKGKATSTARTAAKAGRPPQVAKPAPPARGAGLPESDAARLAETGEPARPLHPRRVWPD